MKNFEESLIGPQSDEREERVIEDVDSSGQPLWMAFLADPEALTINSDEVGDAKNAYENFKKSKPEVIKMCARKTIEEFQDIIREAA